MPGDIKNRFNLRFQMRIGINAGTVVVGAIGDNLRMDYTAVGDTTNLAARLEAWPLREASWCRAPSKKRPRTFFFSTRKVSSRSRAKWRR